MYYIGLDVHKKTISFCVKDAAGRVCQEGKIGSTRYELDAWIKTLPQPRMIAMEATIFTGWIYDHLLPHAEKVKVAHPLMLRAIAAAKRKNDTIDARKIADCLRCDLLPECHMAPTEIRDRRRTLRRGRHAPPGQAPRGRPIPNSVASLGQETGGLSRTLFSIAASLLLRRWLRWSRRPTFTSRLTATKRKPCLEHLRSQWAPERLSSQPRTGMQRSCWTMGAGCSFLFRIRARLRLRLLLCWRTARLGRQ